MAARTKGTAGEIRTVRPRWGAAVLVCGKCLKRHPDGKAVRQAVKTETKSRRSAGARKVRVIKTGCVGLCPRGAVVLASGATLAAGDLLLVRTAEDAAAAVDRLLDAPA